MHKVGGKEHWPNRPKGDFGAMNFGLAKTYLLSEQNPLSDDESNRVVRQGSEHCASKEYCPLT